MTMTTPRVFSIATYALFKQSLPDGWVHGFVLVHLSDLGLDDVIRKSSDYPG